MRGSSAVSDACLADMIVVAFPFYLVCVQSVGLFTSWRVLWRFFDGYHKVAGWCCGLVLFFSLRRVFGGGCTFVGWCGSAGVPLRLEDLSGLCWCFVDFSIAAVL